MAATWAVHDFLPALVGAWASSTRGAAPQLKGWRLPTSRNSMRSSLRESKRLMHSDSSPSGTTTKAVSTVSSASPSSSASERVASSIVFGHDAAQAEHAQAEPERRLTGSYSIISSCRRAQSRRCVVLLVRPTPAPISAKESSGRSSENCPRMATAARRCVPATRRLPDDRTCRSSRPSGRRRSRPRLSPRLRPRSSSTLPSVLAEDGQRGDRLPAGAAGLAQEGLHVGCRADGGLFTGGTVPAGRPHQDLVDRSW